MTGGMMGAMSAMQTAINEVGTSPPAGAPPWPSEPARKKAADEAKAAQQEEKKEAAQEAAYVAEQKKELARLFTLLAGRRLDLEDAELKYRELTR
jgi:hypothetical protein